MDSTTSQLNSSSVGLTAEGVKPYVVIFESLVITIGAVGVVANGATLLAVTRSKHFNHKDRQFLRTQLWLDFVSCQLLVATYIIKLPTIVYTDNQAFSYVFCIFLGAPGTLLWTVLNVSTGNLMVIAIERYFMLVWPITQRNSYQPWMTHAKTASTWVYGILLTVPVNFSTSKVVNGRCISQSFWLSNQLMQFRTVSLFVLVYLAPIAVFIFCYSRAIRVIKHRMKVYTEAGSHTCTEARMINLRRHVALIKTFVMIVVCYSIFWTPARFYFTVCSYFNIQINENASYFTVFFAFLNVCLSPFVYATTLVAVKTYIVNMFRDLRCRQEVHPSVQINIVPCQHPLPGNYRI